MGVGGETVCQGRAAHIAGQKRPREHGGIHPHPLEDGEDDGGEEVGQQGRQDDHARHGESQGAHGHESLLKGLAHAEAVGEDVVNPTQDGEDGEYEKEDIRKRHGGTPYKVDFAE